MAANKKTNTTMSTKRLALCGMLVALAMIFSYVESLIPINFGVPGIKLGLANLVVLAGLYRMKPGEVFMISVTRIVLTGFLFGSGMSIIYSLAGGILSFLVMYLLIRVGGFSNIGVSIAGGVSHNVGQILIAIFIVKTPELVYYLPVLMIAGLITGALMGILTNRLLEITKKQGTAW